MQQVSSSNEEHTCACTPQTFTRHTVYVCTIYRKRYRKCWIKQRVSWKMVVFGKTLMPQRIMEQKRTGQTAPSSLKRARVGLETGAPESMTTQHPAPL